MTWTLTDVHAAALTAFGEARNQTVMGIVAVLSVIKNRVGLKPSWSTWTQVCLADRQFSCWNIGDPNEPLLAEYAALLGSGSPTPYNPTFDVCAFLAEKAVGGTLLDPTGHATHYFNPHAVTKIPAWAAAPAVLTVSMGAHDFYKNVRV